MVFLIHRPNGGIGTDSRVRGLDHVVMRRLPAMCTISVNIITLHDFLFINYLRTLHYIDFWVA